MKKTHSQLWRRRGAAVLLAFCGVMFMSGAVPATYAATDGNTPVLIAATATGSTIPQTRSPNQVIQEEQVKKLQEKFNIPEDVAKFLVNFIVMITIVLKMLYALLVPIAGMIGKFMSNDWVTGTVFKLDVLIETIWQFIRNLVNIVIVLYLIYVAARNVVPYGNDSQYDLKQVLPKVALALVVVNFSLFFCRTVLTIANVTTTMAFSIPSQIGGSVFGGFNVVPQMDGVGLKKIAVEGYKPTEVTAEQWDKIGTDGRAPGEVAGDYSSFQYAWVKPGSTEPIKTTPFNPFVWAEPLGQTERANLSTGCKSPAVPDIQTFVQSDGTKVSTSYCLTTAKDGTKTRTPANTLAGTETVYAMECLHKNYAFNFSESLFSNSGPTLIANPGYDPSSGKYVLQPSHYKRILIQGEYKKAQESSVYADKWNIVYANKQAEVLAQALGVKTAERKPNDSLQTNEDGSIKTADDVAYPYYSDCVTSLDDLSFSARNAMYVYAFNLLRIPSYEKSFTEIQSYADVTVRILMSFFFLLMFFGVTVAMLIAMIARTFYLWFMMALSPIWVLTDVMKIWKGDDVDKEGIIGGYGKFISLAFLPTIMGVILSVGFMMYHFLSYVGGLEGSQRGRFNVGSISLWFDPGEAVGGVGDLFATMFGLFALAALWVAVFAAFKFGFKSFKLASSVLDKIDNTGRGLASFAAKAPLEMPLLPLGKGGAKVSLATLGQLPNAMMSKVNLDRDNKRRDQMAALGMGNYNSLDVGLQQEIKKALEDPTADPAKFASLMNRSRDTYEGKQLNDEVMRSMYTKNGYVPRDQLKDTMVHAGNQEFLLTRKMQQAMFDKTAPEQRNKLTPIYQNSDVIRAMDNHEYSTQRWQSADGERSKLWTSFAPGKTMNIDGNGRFIINNDPSTAKSLGEVAAFARATTTLTPTTVLSNNAAKEIRDVTQAAATGLIPEDDFKTRLATFVRQQPGTKITDFMKMKDSSGKSIEDIIRAIYANTKPKT